MRKKTRTVYVWDNEVEEIFSLWGGETIARYFEALRYRQQLSPDQEFVFVAADIEKKSGLSYKRQLHAKKVLSGCGWIEVKHSNQGKGTRQSFLITALAKEATAHIPHKKDVSSIKRKFDSLRTRHFSTR